MFYEAHIPCEALRPYVQSIAVSESIDGATYKVLPGTGLVIGFQYQGRISHIDNGKEAKLSTAGITGLHDQYRVFKNEGPTGSVLVYFHDAGASAFFKQPIHELFRESVSLENFLLRSELLIIEEKLCAAKTNAEKISVIENFLLSQLRASIPDSLVLGALALIHKSKGTIRIKELLQQLHTSQSPLEKRFRQAVGTSPKKFASIVRFKHILTQYQQETSLTELGYEAGFYDQAHFIKEFKNFTGETPESFFTKE